MLNMTDSVDGFFFAPGSLIPISPVQMNPCTHSIRNTSLARKLRFTLLLEGIRSLEGRMENEKITFGKTGSYASDYINAVGLHLVGR